MVDITKCRGENCELRKRCYRFYSEPCPYRQSYFVATPTPILGPNGPECEHLYERK